MTTDALLRLLHLASPALPVGAFAYSQGLEHAVEAGWVSDEESAGKWILGLLETTLPALDLAVFVRVHAAAGDREAVARWCAFLAAVRGSSELQEEERRMGVALSRVLETLETPCEAPPSYVGLFAWAAARWEVPVEAAAAAFAFAWCENQVAAAMRLVPLGQSSGLRILAAAMAIIPRAVAAALALPDEDIGVGAPALALGSARHETQYSRIFRS